VLLGEPPRSQVDLHFSLFGIPVRVHPFFWLVGLLLGFNSRDAKALLSWMVAFFVSILVHEFGHAVVIRAYGFRPWITLYGLGGLASYDQASTYSSKGTTSAAQVLISLAGPGAGFLFAAAIAGAIIASGHQVQVVLGGSYGLGVAIGQISPPAWRIFLFQLLNINVLWGILNLLPIYPLDGGKIAREVLVAVNPQQGIRQSLMLSIVAAIAVAVVGLTQWDSFWVAFLFGYLAYTSYTTLQAYSGRGRW